MTCIGVVLAGGLSSRMGEDKALLNHIDQTMLNFTHQLLLNSGVDSVAISGEKHGGIQDIYPNTGPLGGVFSVIKQHTPTELLIMPIDMPLMTNKLLKELMLAGRLSHKPAYFKQNPLPLYLPVNGFTETFLNKTLTNLSGKGPSFKELLTASNAISLESTIANELLNTNTPEEWQQAQKLLKSQRSFHVKSFIN